MINTDDKNVTKNRHKYVGGSDLPALMNISDYKTQFELAKEKAGITPVEFKGNEYTKYGHLMEPKIRDYINSQYSTNFNPDTDVNEKEHIRSNCDGLDKEKKILLEVKTNKGNLTESELENYIVQIQLYLYQFNVDIALLAQYTRPENFYTGLLFEEQNADDFFNTEFNPDNLSVIEVPKDQKMIDKILKEIDIFWKRIEKLKEHPEMSEIEYYTSVQIPGIQNIDYGKELKRVEELENKLIEMKKVEEEIKVSKEYLYDLMSAVGLNSFNTNKIIINRIKPNKRISVDSTRLKKERPSIYSEYQKVSNVKGFVKITVRKNNEEKSELTRDMKISESMKNLGL